jgi:hypothetical protein
VPDSTHFFMREGAGLALGICHRTEKVTFRGISATALALMRLGRRPSQTIWFGRPNGTMLRSLLSADEAPVLEKCLD